MLKDAGEILVTWIREVSELQVEEGGTGSNRFLERGGSNNFFFENRVHTFR